MTRSLPFVALLALVAVTGCETVEMPQAEARGNTEEIIVITDSVTWAGPVGEALREELGRPIPTLPSNQGAFQVRFQPLQSRFFESLKVQPNLVFAAPIDAEGDMFCAGNDIGDFGLPLFYLVFRKPLKFMGKHQPLVCLMNEKVRNPTCFTLGRLIPTGRNPQIFRKITPRPRLQLINDRLNAPT